VLLLIDKPAPSESGAIEAYHNGGQVAFGPDGLLYVGVGDGGGWSGNDPFDCAQNPLSPAGKMLRLDLAALQPPAIATTTDSCPFFAVLPAGVEIWASGLRNPWRFSFDRATGDLYIGDVGQDAVEEIDRVAAGTLAGAGPNFGWDVREGNQCNGTDPTPGIPCPDARFTEPIHTYLPADGPYCDAAVTGGVVYRGADAALRGQYFFSDFCQGFVHSLELDAGGAVTAVHDRTAAFAPATGSLELIAGIGEDGNGELLFVDYGFGPGSFTGELYGTAPEPGALAAGVLAVVALFTRRRLATR
jgi:glucose/arabinose dehydrogenase